MKLFLVLITLSFAFFACAQQETIFNQFWNNLTHYSPAYAGLEYNHQAGAIYRSQWNGSKGAPNDVYGFYNTSLGKGWGTGINIAGGTIGLRKKYNASIPVSYKFNVSRKGHLSLGMALGINHQTVEGEYIPPQTTEDPQIPMENEQHLHAHFGVAYKGQFFTGAFGMRNFTIARYGGTEAFEYVPHYYGLARFMFPVGSKSQWTTNSKVGLEALYGYHNGFQSLQLDLRILAKEKFSFFAGYVWNNGIIAGSGWDFYKKYRVMYSITWIRSKLSPITNFTHEISFVYHLPLSE